MTIKLESSSPADEIEKYLGTLPNPSLFLTEMEVLSENFDPGKFLKFVELIKEVNFGTVMIKYTRLRTDEDSGISTFTDFVKQVLKENKPLN